MLKTILFARVTKRLPGPQTLSTLGIVSVPKAMAPMAWAPPIRNSRSAPNEREFVNCIPAKIANAC